jgi:hypothetical protein
LDNFDDALLNLQASFGKGMAGTLLPFMDILTTKIDELVESGKLEAIGQKFANFAQGIDIEAGLNGLLQMAELAAALAGKMTDLVSIWNEFGQSVSFAAGALKYAGDIASVLIGGLGGFGMKQFIDAWMREKEAKRLAKKPMASGDGAGGIFQAASDILNAMKTKPAEDKSVIGTRDELMKAQLDALRQITKNTSPDLQKSILGGGNLGAKGVSLLDLTNRSKRAGSRNISVKVVTLFDQMMDEIFKEFNNSQQKMAGVRGGF